MELRRRWVNLSEAIRLLDFHPHHAALVAERVADAIVEEVFGSEDSAESFEFNRRRFVAHSASRYDSKPDYVDGRWVRYEDGIARPAFDD